MKYFKLLFLSLLVFVAVPSMAQLGQFKNMIDTFLVDFDSAGFLYFKTPNALQPGGCFSHYKSGANDQDNEIILLRKWEDAELKMQHYKFQQTHKGLPVEAAECSEHFDQKGNLIFTNTKFAVNINGRSKPKIKEGDALQIVLKTFGGETQFAWENPEWDAELQEETGDPSATYKPKGELMWALDNYKDLGMYISGNRYRLAYRFEILSFQPHEHKAYFVDAITGQLFRESQLRHSNGPANIAFRGTQTIDTRWDGGFTNAYILHTNNNDRNIHTKYAPTNNTPWGLIPDATDDDDIWNFNNDLATTTHYFVSQSWDYFKIWHTYEGFNNKGKRIKVYVEDSDDNAYFDTPRKLTFGEDSAGTSYGDAIDIVGHEFTHGITENTASLEYMDEPGALNESFSDIFGMMVEFYTDGGLPDWTLGNPPNTLPARSLEFPKLFGVHFRDSVACDTLDVGQPHTYEGEFYYTGNCDFGGVHVNSGVQNKWFQLLVDGGNGINDNNDTYTIQGIGHNDAARIAFWNLTNVLQSGSQFADARTGAITSAELLFPTPCSNEVIQTTNAWYAVGVGDESTCAVAGVREMVNKNLFTLFPNPTRDMVNISFSNTGIHEVLVYSMDGRLIKQFNNAIGTLSFSMNDVSKGIYIVEVNGGNLVARKKLVINE